MDTPRTITPDDARAWGREAFEMGLTLERAQDDIRHCGCHERLMCEVAVGYGRARGQALHREW